MQRLILKALSRSHSTYPANRLTPFRHWFLPSCARQLHESSRLRAKGVIFTSAKPRNFIAGADLFEIKKMTPAQAGQYLADGQTLYSRIENLPCPTVAAINGDCLGGGLELALACRSRVTADESWINIGLPEVKLGIVPGWGGTVRLPRLIGLTDALRDDAGGQNVNAGPRPAPGWSTMWCGPRPCYPPPDASSQILLHIVSRH